MYCVLCIVYCLLCITFPKLILAQNNNAQHTNDSLQYALQHTNNAATRLSISYELGKLHKVTRLTYWDSLRILAHNTPRAQATEGNILNQLGNIYYNQNNYTKAHNYYYRSLIIRQSIKDTRGIAAILLNIGNVYNAQGDGTQALVYFIKSLTLSTTNKDSATSAKTLYNIGNTYYTQGGITQALDYYNKSLTIASRIGNKTLQANIVQSIAAINTDRGAITQALQNYTQASTLYSQMGNTQGIANCLMNIGSIYQTQNDVTQALANYTKALKLHQQINNRTGVINALLNTGSVYLTQHNTAKAITNFRQALRLSHTINDKGQIANSLQYIGNVQAKLHHADSALQYYTQSLALFTTLGYDAEICGVLDEIANAYLTQHKYLLAHTYAYKALKLANTLAIPEYIRNTEYVLAQTENAQGNYESAYHHYQNYVLYKDSIANDANRKASINNQLSVVFTQKETELKAKATAQKLISLKDKEQQRILLALACFILLLVAVFAIIMYRRFKITQTQKDIIEAKELETQSQKHIIEEKHCEITDSINYAERIQRAILPNDELLAKNLLEYFLYFKPKDVVSGDFYWATEHNNNFYLAVCDSTGHGVPGAFMSLLNIGILSEAIKEKNIMQPAEIFNYVRERLIAMIGDSGQKDGMNGILICINKTTQQITYAAANNAPILVIKANNELHELPKDKMPVGKGESIKSFTNHSINTNSGDILYLYTDGMPDQFGGPKGKKFMQKQLKQLLVSIAHLPMPQQQQCLANALSTWQGTLEQVDDVLVIGVRV